MKDIRTLCQKCAREMERAGYRLIRYGSTNRSECDKCSRQGYQYWLNK